MTRAEDSQRKSIVTASAVIVNNVPHRTSHCYTGLTAMVHCKLCSYHAIEFASASSRRCPTPDQHPLSRADRRRSLQAVKTNPE
jgi:hypothetical protein